MGEMLLREYQVYALRTARIEGADMEVYTALGLAGEAGEYVEQVKHEKFHGWAPDRAHKLEEIGDLLWYVAVAAAAQGASLEEVARGNIAKLRARYPDGFDAKRSQERRNG